jgi:hypothetical protein
MIENNPPAAAPSPEPTAQPAQQTTMADLDSLLAEFTRETSKPAPQPQVQQQQQPSIHEPGWQDATDPAINDAMARAQAAFLEAQKNGLATDGLKSKLDLMIQHIQQMQADQRRMVDHNDFEKLVGEANKRLQESGVAVSEDFAKRFLASESLLN